MPRQPMYARSSGNTGSPTTQQRNPPEPGGGVSIAVFTRRLSNEPQAEKPSSPGGRKALCPHRKNGFGNFHRFLSQSRYASVLEFRRTHGAAMLIPFRASGAATGLDAHRG